MGYVVGVDLGQAQDFSTIAVDEYDGTHQVRHLERIPLGQSYNNVATRIGRVVEALPSPRLVVDATGVGRAVIDMLRGEGLAPVPVSITAGQKARVTPAGCWVPKRVLVRPLVGAFEDGRVKVAKGLPYADALVGELAEFKVTVNAAGHDRYEAARGHDDLIIAVALAVWFAEGPGRPAILMGTPGEAGLLSGPSPFTSS